MPTDRPNFSHQKRIRRLEQRAGKTPKKVNKIQVVEVIVRTREGAQRLDAATAGEKPYVPPCTGQTELAGFEAMSVDEYLERRAGKKRD